MANMINVDGSDDPSYRYKMPRLISKVEGRGNGVKTALMNCSEVAQALHRSTAQLTKFFGCEMGAMTNYDKGVDRALVNGAFETGVLQEALTTYIQKFVLCPSCGNPETVQEMKGKKKSATILLNCKACGASEEADNAHKLVTFIVKEMAGEGGATNKKEERRKKKLERNKKRSEDQSEDGSSTAVKKKKKKKDKEKDKSKDKDKKKKKKKKRETKESSADSDEENAVDEVGEQLGAMTVHDVAALNTSVDRVTDLIVAKSSDDDIISAVVEQQTNSGLRKADRVPILFFAIYNSKVSLAECMQKMELLTKIIEPVKDCFLTPEDLEIELLLCLEESVARANAEEVIALKNMIPVVLKSLFDEDLIDEKTIINWHTSTLDEDKYKHVRCIVDSELVEEIKKQATPIIEWLKDAETDSDESEEEEED